MTNCKDYSKTKCKTKKNCKYVEGPKRKYCTRKISKSNKKNKKKTLEQHINANQKHSFIMDPCKLLSKISYYLNGNIYRYKSLSTRQKEFIELFIPNVTKEDSHKYRINNKILTVREKIDEGSNGKIFRAKWNGKNIILKVAKNDKMSTSEFMTECLIHNDLYCSLVGKYGNSSARIPKIEFIAKIPLNNGSIKFVIGMEYLNMDGHEFLKQHFNNNTLCIDMIKQISVLLCKLQKDKNFMHKDLHVGNIMCKKMKSNSYRWYIIDFGMTSISNGKQLIHFLIDSPYSDVKIKSFNSTHDLRMLIASIYGKMNRFKETYENNNTLNVFEIIINIYGKYLENYIKKKINKPFFYSSYEQVVNYKDELFQPKKIHFVFNKAKNNLTKDKVKPFLSKLHEYIYYDLN